MQANFLLQRELNNRIAFGKNNSPGFPVHFHSHLEIYQILSGEVEVLINNQRKILRRGEISVALSYDAHGYRALCQSSAHYLIIPTSCCGEFLPLIANKHLPSPFLSDPDLFETVLHAMEMMIAAPNDLLRRGCAYVILGAILARMTDAAPGDTQEPGFSADMLIYISRHFREELTLTMLAKHFGYNPSYLSRTFRSTFGISFAKYLTMLRLREAVLMMRAEQKNVTHAALECGFGSMRSFYRAFHEEFGCPPKQYLENVSNHSH